jgi:hypothetical protein
MTAGHEEVSAELVRKIVREALDDDAREILVTIRVMECQNTGGVNERLSATGAAHAGMVVRNALISHLIIRIARIYSDARVGDLHLRRAFAILRDKQIRAEFEVDATSKTALCEAEGYFQERLKDDRRERIKHFRDKIVAHRGKLKDIPMPEFEELFAFACATIEAIEKLAFAIKIARVRVKDKFDDAESVAEAFWHPWKGGA